MIRTTLETETDVLWKSPREPGFSSHWRSWHSKEVLGDYHAGNDHADHRAMTLEQDGQPVGFAYYAPTAMTDRTWHLYWIFVPKASQAKGWARSFWPTSRPTSPPGAGSS